MKNDDWRDRGINEDEYVLLTNKVMLMYQMYAFAHDRNEGWVPDWEDTELKKWGLTLNNVQKVQFDFYRNINFFIFGVSVKSREIAEEMAKEFGERIEEIYTKQY